MSKRITVLKIEIEWDDEKKDHPIHWATLSLYGLNKGISVELLSYEDFDEERNLIGTG